MRGRETANVLKSAVMRMKYFCAKDGTEKGNIFPIKWKSLAEGQI